MELFRHCPGCGRRFHIILERKERTSIDRRLLPSFGHTVRTHAHQRLSAPMTVNYDRPIFLAVEEFSYHYKCEHCGHEWTEHNEQIHWEESLKPSKKAEAVRSRHMIALLTIGLIATASLLGSAYAFHWFGNTGNGALSRGTPTCNNSQSTRFTVVMSTYGYNYSVLHSIPPPGYPLQVWPRMNVTIGSNVDIHVLNNATLILRFAINYYFNPGVTVPPGGSHVVTFCASTLGTFTILDPDGYVNGYAQLNVR